MFDNFAVVIGNGESRKNINIQKLTGRITLVGCNALHRDAIVDHLVCVDDRMVQEAILNINNQETNIYVRENSLRHRFSRLRTLPSIPNATKERIDQSINWGSGTFALLIASQLPNIQEIYIIGFDLYGNGQYVNNLYKNTKNYAADNSRYVNPEYWIRQSAKIFKIYDNIMYRVINLDHWPLPHEWCLPNVSFETIENFKIRFEV